MEKFEKNFSEANKEQMEKPPHATFFISRHGDTEYNEEFVDPETQEDLTDLGKEQIKNLAHDIESQIREGEKVYVMQSPRVRAQKSAQILENELKDSGHEVEILGGGRSSLSNVKMLDEEGRHIRYEHGEKERYLSAMAKILKRIKGESDYYFKSRRGEVENPITDIEKIKGRVSTMLRRLIEVARKRKGDNEKLILATHGEWLDTILELYFGKEILTAEDQADKGEMIKLEVHDDHLTFSFRGEEVIIKDQEENEQEQK